MAQDLLLSSTNEIAIPAPEIFQRTGVERAQGGDRGSTPQLKSWNEQRQSRATAETDRPWNRIAR